MKGIFLFAVLLLLVPSLVYATTYVDTGPDSPFNDGNVFGTDRYTGLNVTFFKNQSVLISYHYNTDELIGWGSLPCAIYQEGISAPIHTATADSSTCTFNDPVIFDNNTNYALTIYSNEIEYENPYTFPLKTNNTNFTSGFISGTGSAYNNFWVSITTVTTIDGIASVCENGDPNELLRFNLRDEDTPPTHHLADFEIEGEISGTPFFFGDETTQDNISVCITGENITLETVTLKTVTGAITTFHYLLPPDLNTGSLITTQVYTLNTTSTSDLRLTVRDLDTYQPKEDIFVKLQRKYLSEGVWRTVQMSRTGDFGLAHFNIYEETQDYRMIFQDSEGCVLDTTPSMKFSCSDSLCELTKILSVCDASATDDELTLWVNYTNSTKVVTMAWDDPTGVTTNITSLVTKMLNTGQITICSQTSNGASGTQTCNLTGHYGLFKISLSAIQNGVTVQKHTEFLHISEETLAEMLTVAESSLWTFAIVVTCVGFGLISPLYAVVTMIIGLIIAFSLGITSAITLTFIIVSAVMGIAIGIKVRN